MSHGIVAIMLLRQYIVDETRNVFIVNHFPCHQFVRGLKRIFPKSKVVVVVHDQTWTAPLLGDVGKFKMLLKRKNCKSMDASQRQLIIDLQQQFKYERKGYQLAHAVVCLAMPTYELLRDLYKVDVDKLYCISNGVDCNDKIDCTDSERKAFLRKAGISENKKILIYAGRLAPVKGVEELVKAFLRVSCYRDDIHLVIAGRVRDFELVSKWCLDSPGRITFTGLMQHGKLQEWLQVADVGILTSYAEQCSYTGIEMMQHIGVIVSSDGWNLSDMFENEENAIIAHIPYESKSCNSDFCDNIEAALHKAVNMDEVSKLTMRRNCKSRVDLKYGLDNMRIKYEDMFNKLTPQN